ncbi:MAG: NADH-quinone oxidoreductase subunit NuoH [Chloroflexi bacterium HGW-Chloroflexi-2]|jgi:NADH-quinone oxidoreductase subunit H|nr:MAG: NADH-quinone oxidoreductase subunit NuoH [Chloroflexi bacterium HGW-Chloroflexi-2]
MKILEFLSDPIIGIENWIVQLLENWGVAPEWQTFIVYLIGAAILGTGALLFTLILIWAERKIIGRLQDRLGPNRVGPWGIFQPVADMLKIFIKEHIIPDEVDPIPYHLAPIISVASVLLLWSVVPFSDSVRGSNLNVALLFILGVGGLGELGVILAGWGSNNKYSMLAAFRASAQMISYEVPMAIVLLTSVILSGSMALGDIVKSQNIAYIFFLPLGAFIFFIASIAENGRAPFDLAEAESELVAGFNVEYSGLKFGMFYVADFLRAFTSAVIFSSIFLGGWRGPGAEQIPILGFVYLLIKSVIVWFLGVWIRGSLPRFRVDQMMAITWKFLTPLALALFIVVAFVTKLIEGTNQWLQVLIFLVINVALYVVGFAIVRKCEKEKERKVVSTKKRALAQPTNPFTQSETGG